MAFWKRKNKNKNKTPSPSQSTDGSSPPSTSTSAGIVPQSRPPPSFSPGPRTPAPHAPVLAKSIPLSVLPPSSSTASRPITPRIPSATPLVPPASRPSSSSPASRPITHRIPAATPLVPPVSRPSPPGTTAQPINLRGSVNNPVPIVPTAPSAPAALPSHPALPPVPQIEPVAPSKRTPTDSSYYSCSNLPPSDQARYLKAADVRRQVAGAPLEPVEVLRTNRRGQFLKSSGYPKVFGNRERIQGLQAAKPLTEYPVKSKGPWDPRIIHSMGAARALYNDSDKTKFDVVYHDPTKPGGYGGDMTVASYRPAVGVAQAKA
ncbi:hypothetical protein CcaCcLH18_02326 [Colletotrichum camelliae]|nr:hypothetical protein CcaCcLH18_02326 [Colletotrichum camelliae]